jgi:hypothetical protein
LRGGLARAVFQEDILNSDHNRDRNRVVTLIAIRRERLEAALKLTLAPTIDEEARTHRVAHFDGEISRWRFTQTRLHETDQYVSLQAGRRIQKRPEPPFSLGLGSPRKKDEQGKQ